MSKKLGILKPFVRSAYNYDRGKASDESGIEITGESMAIQSAKDECDINTIVRRFGVTGQLPQGVRRPTYADFGEEVFDFQTAMNAVKDAKDSFLAMPAHVRKRFGNDPQEFVEFCSDPENLPEMRKLGLAVPEEDDKIGARGDVPRETKKGEQNERSKKGINRGNAAAGDAASDVGGDDEES